MSARVLVTAGLTMPKVGKVHPQSIDGQKDSLGSGGYKDPNKPWWMHAETQIYDKGEKSQRHQHARQYPHDLEDGDKGADAQGDEDGEEDEERIHDPSLAKRRPSWHSAQRQSSGSFP